jgi:GNAT superfamily N-acetyltransferase
MFIARTNARFFAFLYVSEENGPCVILAGMKIRIATLEDIARMHEIRMAVRENQLRDPTKVAEKHYREMLEDRGRGWVCEIEPQGMMGFAIADARTRSIWALFVKPGQEGRGAGRALHDAMVQWLFEVSSEPLWLTTEPGTRAARFYEAAGWTPDGVTEDGETRFMRVE